MKLPPDLRHPMLEPHGLLEFIKVISPAQATMLDPIQMFLRVIRLGSSLFTIEHRSYQFVRLQGTNVIQSFLFAFCDRASELLIRSPSRNQLDLFFFSELGRTCTTRRLSLGQIQGGCALELCSTSLSPKDNG